MTFRGFYPFPGGRPLEPIEPPRGGTSTEIAQHGQTRNLESGQKTSVLRWRSSDSGVEQVSIVLGIVLKQAFALDAKPIGQPTPIVQAELRWGIGGATHTAFVDYMLGAQVALAASEVEVIAHYVNKSTIPVEVTASLSRNIKPNACFPSAVLTQHFGAASGEASFVGLVPSWATHGSVSFLPTAGGAVLRLTGFDAGIGVSDGGLWQQDVSANGTSFPVVSGQSAVGVAILSGAVSHVALQYAFVF